MTAGPVSYVWGASGKLYRATESEGASQGGCFHANFRMLMFTLVLHGSVCRASVSPTMRDTG